MPVMTSKTGGGLDTANLFKINKKNKNYTFKLQNRDQKTLLVSTLFHEITSFDLFTQSGRSNTVPRLKVRVHRVLALTGDFAIIPKHNSII